MKIAQLLGKDMVTAFDGSLDAIPEDLFYESAAADLLAQSLKTRTGGSTAFLFSDQRTRAAAGERCLQGLDKAGWSIQEINIPDGPDGSDPITSEQAKNQLKAQLPEADAYIAVGSGVINDIVKWIAAEKQKPYAVYATAASMNGYTAANVAASIDGVKRLFSAKAPIVIGADPAVIENAPSSLTTSGLGDVMAKPVSTADWLFNHLFTGEAFSKEVAGIINHVEPLYLENPRALAAREPDAIKGLMTALVLSGCAMTLQGSSLPASGGEHLISHTLDMKSAVDKHPHDRHGRQVGVATIFAAALYQKIMAIENIDPRTDALVFDAAYWGSLAGPVELQYTEARKNMNDIAEKLTQGNAWDNARSQLVPLLRDPAVIKDCLKQAGAAYRIEDIGCSKDQFCNAVRNCACMRARFTSIDLGFMLGVLPNKIEDIVEQYLM